MLEHYYAVIMAGGGGTRLWPLSRQARPKQMLALFDERSMFQTAVDRIRQLFPPERIFVVTVQEQAQELQAQCSEIPIENYLIEPAARGTASVVGLAGIALQQIDPQAIMAVLGSDHFIADEARFRQILRTAGKIALDGNLVTLGIQPASASTGFGYIQRGSLAADVDDCKAYQVIRFKEKPDQEQADKMIADGQHLWNSGMFIWQVKDILNEIQRQMPELFFGLRKISQAWGTSQAQEVVAEVWTGLRNETIDYGIMEHAQKVVVLPAVGLGWSDVGSWDSLFDLLVNEARGDEKKNIVMGGEHIGLDTERSLIYVNQPHRLIVTIGVQDLVVVDTGDVLLICDKDKAQQVRQVVKQLKERGQDYV